MHAPHCITVRAFVTLMTVGAFPCWQPQFLKDLFPDAEKPEFGDVGKKIGDFFSGLLPKEEEPEPPAAEPAPEDAPEGDPEAAADA